MPPAQSRTYDMRLSPASETKTWVEFSLTWQWWDMGKGSTGPGEKEEGEEGDQIEEESRVAPPVV